MGITENVTYIKTSMKLLYTYCTYSNNIMALHTIGNQFNETSSYGKANLDKLQLYQSANSMSDFLTTHYRVTPTTIAQVFGTRTMTLAEKEERNLYQHSGYKIIPETNISKPELITSKIVITALERLETAMQTADSMYTRYQQEIVNNPMTLTGNIAQDKIYKNSYLHTIAKNIYNTHYATNNQDVSMYELQTPTDTQAPTSDQGLNFSQLSVIFTSRMGPLHYNKIETLDTMLMQPLVERNGMSVAHYGAEYLTEMLQVSIPFSFQTTNTIQPDYVSPESRSCGFFIMRDPKNHEQVINIRMYVAHVFKYTLADTDYPIAISSGFDLSDIIDMTTFKEGDTSNNFVVLFNNIMLTLNSAVNAGFTSTDTLWEVGPIQNFDTLRCKSAPSRPHWTGALIKDCIIPKGTVDIPARVKRQLEHIHTTYNTLNNGQLILFPFPDSNTLHNATESTEIVATIIHIIKNGAGNTSMQTKEARIDTIFPLKPLGTDIALARDLLVENIKGEPLFSVDTATESMTIRGKLGVGQNIPNTTVDIDDTSVGDMTTFIGRVANKINEVKNICNGVQNLLVQNDMQWYNAITQTISPITLVAQSTITEAVYYLGTYPDIAGNGETFTHYVIFSSLSNHVKTTTNAVSMPELTFTEAQWNALNNNTDGHLLIESMTMPTHTQIQTQATNSGNPEFIYKLDTTTNNAKDSEVLYYATRPTWYGHTLQHIIETINPDEEDSIRQSVLPPVQSTLSDSLCYAESIKSFISTDNTESKYVITGTVLFGKSLTSRRLTMLQKLRDHIVALQKIAKNAEIDAVTYLMTINGPNDSPLGGTWNGGDATDLDAMGDLGVQRAGGTNLSYTHQEIWRYAFIYTLQWLIQLITDMGLDIDDFWTHVPTINLTNEHTRLQQELTHILSVGYALDINNNITSVQDNSPLYNLIELHTLFNKLYVTPTLYIIGCVINLRDNQTHVRNTIHVQEWFRRMHAIDVRMNLVKYYHTLDVDTFGYGLEQAETNITALIDKYPGLTTNMHIYNMTNTQTTLSINSMVTQATIGNNHTPTPLGATTIINDVTDVVLQDMHVLFVTQYAAATTNTPFNVNTIGTFGARGYMHPHAYYFVFYQLSNTHVLVFYADMSTDFFAPSFRLTGDMDIRGELTVKDGVWIGGKLLRVTSDGQGLIWGNLPVVSPPAD